MSGAAAISVIANVRCSFDQNQPARPACKPSSVNVRIRAKRAFAVAGPFAFQSDGGSA